MHRLNKYIHFISIDNHFFLYDISSRTVIALNPRLYKLLLQYQHKIDEIENIHPDLYQNMIESGMIVDNTHDEVKNLINRFRMIDTDPSSFSIIINPTLDCNLRCWYCYESHRKGTMMKPHIVEAIKRLLNNKLLDHRLKHLNISFFGGEPLLGWHKVVMPLLTYATTICNTKEIALSVSFTTNGVLLSESKYNELVKLNLTTASFQITLDGNKILHDNSRIGLSRKPTYDTIMKNVKIGARKGFNIKLRFNYTPENLPSFLDVLTDLDELSPILKKYITCNFQKVWQAGNNLDKEHAIDYVNLFNKAGINTSCDTIYWRHLCYADRENQITINYNGDLYSCTAREFTPETREGLLTESGHLTLNERYKQRMDIKYKNTSCIQCEILPLCNGGCSQAKLEHGNITSCPLGYNSLTRKNIIIGSFHHSVFGQILTQQEINNKQYKIIN